MSIPVLTLCTDKNTTSVDLDRITIRQSEAGLVINANLIDADNNAYNLTNCKVAFGENKDGGKMIADDNVTITDATAGQISYKLNEAVYQVSGSAWFEITNTANILIDTTTNFHIEVIKQADLVVDNDNYWSQAENMLTHVQAYLNKTQADLDKFENDKTADINKLISDTNTTLQSYKDQLADYDAKYKALDTNWNNEIAKLDATINATNTQAVQDFKTQRDSLNTQFTQFETDLKTDLNSKITDINSAITTLSDTTLPDLNAKADTITKKIADLKADFASIDFNSFVKPADLAVYDKSVDGILPDEAGNVNLVLNVTGGEELSQYKPGSNVTITAMTLGKNYIYVGDSNGNVTALDKNFNFVKTVSASYNKIDLLRYDEAKLFGSSKDLVFEFEFDLSSSDAKSIALAAGDYITQIAWDKSMTYIIGTNNGNCYQLDLAAGTTSSQTNVGITITSIICYNNIIFIGGAKIGDSNNDTVVVYDTNFFDQPTKKLDIGNVISATNDGTYMYYLSENNQFTAIRRFDFAITNYSLDDKYYSMSFIYDNSSNSILFVGQNKLLKMTLPDWKKIEEPIQLNRPYTQLAYDASNRQLLGLDPSTNAIYRVNTLKLPQQKYSSALISLLLQSMKIS